MTKAIRQRYGESLCSSASVKLTISDVTKYQSLLKREFSLTTLFDYFNIFSNSDEILKNWQKIKYSDVIYKQLRSTFKSRVSVKSPHKRLTHSCKFNLIFNITEKGFNFVIRDCKIYILLIRLFFFVRLLKISFGRSKIFF